MSTQCLAERRSFPPRPALITTLPFIADRITNDGALHRSFWCVPPTDDYAHACAVGRQYACVFLQYLKQNPFWVGMNLLGQIAQAAAHEPVAPAMHGYAVGFWSFLEQVMTASALHVDHYALAEADAQRYAALLSARQTAGEAA